LPDADARQKRQFAQLVAFTQKLWRDGEFTRDEFFWKKPDRSSPAKWDSSCEPLRAYFHDEVIGKLPAPSAATAGRRLWPSSAIAITP
jgi:hypothetical protein